MYAKFVTDAEPDDIAEATRAIDSLENEEPEEKPVKDEDPIAKLTADVAALQQQVADLAKAKDEETKPETTALDELEQELQSEQTTDEPDESSVTVSPEQIQDGDNPEEQTTPAPASTATDKAVALSILRAVKPIIAGLPDGQRRKAADSLNKAMRDAMIVKPTQSLKGGYSALAKRKATDSAVKTDDKRDFGNNCRKRNPHYKEVK